MCGIFAFLGTAPERPAILNAVKAIRHRGQDGFGFWLSREAETNPQVSHFRQSGKIDPDALGPLLAHGFSAGKQSFVAHWRYATKGHYSVEEAQPILIDQGATCLVHNGQFGFSKQSQKTTGTDTQTFSHLVEGTKLPGLLGRVSAILSDVTGAYTVLAATQGSLVLARDRFGFRPFFYGKYPGGVAVASETTALFCIGCDDIQEVKPGSIIEWSESGVVTTGQIGAENYSLCAFEPIYFHGADGLLNGIPVRQHRFRLGRQLAAEYPVVEGAVVSVPRSADAFAAGFADALGLELLPAIRLKPDCARTFIQNPTSRQEIIRQKYQVQDCQVRGRIITLVDDSLVRGSTLRYLVSKLRAAGAAEIHARIGSPPFKHPCFYGINVPNPAQLIFHQRTVSDVAQELQLDSLYYLSVAGLKKVLGNDLCVGCFSGQYPEETLVQPAALTRVAHR